MRTRCDVIIVGGGPAGSSCARDLVSAGLDVLVIDRARFPRDKCCAGWITPQVVAALDLDLGDYARSATLQPVTGFRTGVIGHREVLTDYGEVVSYAIRRLEFDDYLLRRAGARLATGIVVENVTRAGDRWVINDKFEAPALVGAGGHFCPVARVLNPEPDRGPVVVAQEVETMLPPDDAVTCALDATVPSLYFCPDRRGYGWCVRKGDYLNVGFGRLRDGPLPAQVDVFRSWLQDRGVLPPGLPTRWPGHAYRLYAHPRRALSGDGVLLVGDSAGLAHPVSGEGILTAVESGRLAAQALLDADGTYSRGRLSPYAAAIERRYGRPGRSTGRRWLLPAGVVNRLAVGLMATRWFPRRVLLERWFLHRHLPPLGLDAVPREGGSADAFTWPAQGPVPSIQARQRAEDELLEPVAGRPADPRRG